MTAPEQLRAAMRAHDHEAPTDVPWPADPAARPARSRTRLVLAGALVAAVLVAGGLVAVLWPRDTRTNPAAPLACPATWMPTGEAGTIPTPAAPTVPGASERLAPETAPTQVLVCGYTTASYPSSTAPVALTGSVELVGNLAPVATTLADLPPTSADVACAMYLSATDANGYLIGLTYDDGVQWVAAPGDHCAGSGNGAFTSSTNIAADAAAWLAKGSWAPKPDPAADPTSGPAQPQCPIGPGRLGQETTMVPGTPTALTVCVTPAVDGAFRVVTAPAGARKSVMDVLNAESTSPFTNQGFSPATGDSYSLVFSYPSGPGVTVSVLPGSSSEVFNGSLQSRAAGDLLPLLADLTR